MLQADPRIETILNLLFELARGKLDARAPHHGTGDALDAIIESVNMLAEELNASVVSKGFLESILDSMIDMLLVVNPDGSIRIANQSVCRALGYTPAELVGRNLKSILGQPQRELLIASLFLPEPIRELEISLSRKGGAALPVVISSSMLRDSAGTLEMAVIAARDISERLRAQQRIEHLNRVLRANRNVCQLLVQEKNPDKLIEGVCGHLMETEHYQHAWAVLCDVAGMPVQWIEAGKNGRSSPTLEWLVAETVPPCGSPVLNQTGVVTREQISTACSSCRFCGKHLKGAAMLSRLNHGEKVFGLLGVTMAGSQVPDEEEQLLFVEMAKDIGLALHGLELEEERDRERLRLEEQLHHAQKMEAVGRLAGGIAHDFNNIMTAIIFGAQFLQQALDPLDPAARDAEEIEREARRAAALTQQLLAFSRKSIIQPRRIMVNTLIVDMQRMLRRIVGEDIEIRLDLAENLSEIIADASHLEQVIANLVVNARDAMPDGGRLTLETSNVELDDEYSCSHLSIAPGLYVLLAISDTGTGMSPEVQERIFEPFFTTKREGKGTGLGLATVYGIVRQFGGQVWVYSEPGMGTTFKVYFPRAPELSQLDEANIAMDAPLGRGEIVLLVEDEDTVRGNVRRVLEQRGYQVLDARNGTQAVQLVESHAGEIHVVLTDVVLPGMSGRVLIEQLRSKRPGLPAVYMSGYTENAIAHHGVLDEGIFFVQKPFEIDDLLCKLQQALAAARS